MNDERGRGMPELTEEQRREIGRHRRSIRARRSDLSQRALAERAGVHADTVANVELGKAATDDTLRALASALGVSVAEYVGPDVPVSAAPAPDPTPAGSTR